MKYRVLLLLFIGILYTRHEYCPISLHYNWHPILPACLPPLQGRKKKPFIDKKKAQKFHLVPRSQHDPLLGDSEEPQHVLKPQEVGVGVGGKGEGGE